MIERVFVVILAALGIFAIAACDEGGSPDAPTVASYPTPAAAITAQATSAPANAAPVLSAATATRAPGGSGVPVVDSVIAAVTARDTNKLVALLHFWPQPCTGQRGIGSIPCPADAAVGTTVMVIGSGSCEGSFLQPGDPAITVAIQQFVTSATKLHAVLNANTFPTSSDLPPGKYQVIFEPGIAVSVDDMGVTYLSFGCGATSAAAFIATGRFGSNPDYLVQP